MGGGLAGGGGAGAGAFWSGVVVVVVAVDDFHLGLQPLPGSEGDGAVEAVGQVLHRDDALVQDGDLVVGFRARHAVGGEAFAQLSLDHRHVLGVVHGIPAQEPIRGVGCVDGEVCFLGDVFQLGEGHEEELERFCRLRGRLRAAGDDGALQLRLELRTWSPGLLACILSRPRRLGDGGARPVADTIQERMGRCLLRRYRSLCRQLGGLGTRDCHYEC